MYPILGGGNVNMWHDHMYVHCTLITKQLSFQWHIYNSSKVVFTCNYNVIPKKIKHD